MTWPSRVDRGRTCSNKLYLIVDSGGIPLAATVTGCNRNDVTQLLPLVDGVGPVRGRPGGPRQRAESLIADRGYDHDKYRRELRARVVKPIIARRATQHGSGLGKLRWVLERTFAWPHSLRRLRTRYERGGKQHQAFLDLGCAMIWQRILRAARTSGERKTLTSIPSIRGVHHFAYAVPNLDEAVAFFTDVLGAETATRFGPLADRDGDTFAEKLGIHPRAELRSALLRFGPTLNVELHEYQAPDQRDSPPRQSDPGASHLGVWVDDLDAAADYLRNQPGVVVRTVGPGGPPELDGLTNFFFETPWGQVIEVLTAPDHLPYEQDTDVRLYRPGGDWSDRP